MIFHQLTSKNELIILISAEIMIEVMDGYLIINRIQDLQI